MNPDKSPQNLFNEALERDNLVERGRFDDACGVDSALRERVEKLLRAHDEAGGFFSQPSKAPSSAPASGTIALPLTEKPGDLIGRYKLLQQIGEGGCGVVYMAEQEEPVRRRVALKVIKLGMDTKQVIARFDAERQALALMDHPNIAKVLDAGATGTGRPYFVMELVRGVKITEFCDENKLSTEDRLKLFMLVCQAIQHAHQKGIIHRDIKPSNILVTINDGVPVPKVIDFGIAKATVGRLTDQTLFTAFEQFIGTPAYMSPEQAVLTSLDIDTRSDIYSLGVLLYELLTGSPPFDQKELLAAGLDGMRRTIREAEPPRPSTRLSTMAAEVLTATAQHRHTEPPKLFHLVRGDLDWIVMKCLEKDRARRYETANGLARDIERHLKSEPVIARPPSRLYEFQKTVRRHKFGFSAGAALIVVMAIGVLASTVQAVRAIRAEREQTRLRERAEANEKKAESEAAKSRQVATFLKDMLASVEPSVALGRDATMLREILDKTAQRVSKDLTNQPEVEAELLSTIGVTYFGLGDSQKAIEIHREALRLRRKLFGETNVWVAASLNELGDALEIHQNWLAAEAVLRQALAIRRLLLGNNHPDTARSLTALAGVLLDLKSHGRTLPEAETLQREALAVQANLFPEGSDDVSLSLNNLGTIVMDQKRLREAEVIHREALELSRKLHGAEHPDVATALSRLGRGLVRQNKLSEAEPWLRDGYLMRRKFLGNEHEYVYSSLRAYEETLNLQGKFTEAEILLREHLALRQKTEPDPQTAYSLERLTIALLGQAKLSEADGTRREAVAMRQSVALKAADSSDAQVLHEPARWLATCEEAAFRDGPRAARMAKKAVLATDRKDPFILATLAAAYAEVGQFEMAVSVQKEAMGLLADAKQTADFSSRLKLYVANQPCRDSDFMIEVANSIAAAVFNLLGQGKAAETEKPARACLALLDQVVPEDWRTFNARSLLGGSLLSQKKNAEAEPLLIAGYEGMKRREDRIPAADKVRLKEAIELLVRLYEATGQPEKATEWNKKLAEFDQAEARK